MKHSRIALAAAAITLVAPLASVPTAQAATIPFAHGEQRVTLTSNAATSDGQTVDFTCVIPAGWTNAVEPAKRGAFPSIAIYEGDDAHMACSVVMRDTPIDDAWLDQYVKATTRKDDKVTVVSKGTDGSLMRELIYTHADGTTEYTLISADGRRILSSDFTYPTADAASWNRALHDRRSKLVTIVKSTKPTSKPSTTTAPKSSDKPGRGVSANTGVFDRK